jgi:hypothetical protein
MANSTAETPYGLRDFNFFFKVLHTQRSVPCNRSLLCTNVVAKLSARTRHEFREFLLLVSRYYDSEKKFKRNVTYAWSYEKST